MSDDDVFEVLGDEDLGDDAEIFGEIDWDEAFSDTPTEVDWLVEPFIEAGALVAMFSPPKEGKSLLALEIAASLAVGRPVLHEDPEGRGRHVLYVDFENNQKDFVRRLRDMNFTAAELKGWLHYISFPNMKTLDTEEGGRQLHANALKYGAELVVIDTVSRVIEGGENDADTFKEMYRHSLSRLKRDGIACIRLDHTGKDAEKGQRGSSAKNADVDVVWSLTKTGQHRVRLVRVFARQPHYPVDITMNRVTDPHLRHETDRIVEMEAEGEEAQGGATPGVTDLHDAVDPRVLKALRELDKWCVPLDMGRPTVKAKYPEIKISDRALNTAIQMRRKRG